MASKKGAKKQKQERSKTTDVKKAAKKLAICKSTGTGLRRIPAKQQHCSCAGCGMSFLAGRGLATHYRTTNHGKSVADNAKAGIQEEMEHETNAIIPGTEPISENVSSQNPISLLDFPTPPDTPDSASSTIAFDVSACVNPALCPPVLRLFVRNYDDIASVGVQESLIKEPCLVLRNFDVAVGLNTGFFTTKRLALAAPGLKVELRIQRKSSDEEDAVAGWNFESSKEFMTLGKYGNYQIKLIQEQFQELLREQFPLSSGKAIQCPANKKPISVKFATNVDLVDKSVWEHQLAEMRKMPAFCQMNSSRNMFKYLQDNEVYGVSTAQMYLKVPGCRTPAHQENLNFCSINLNIGPGDCEWFCVSNTHWNLVLELCEKNNVKYLSGSWWPNLT